MRIVDVMCFDPLDTLAVNLTPAIGATGRTYKCPARNGSLHRLVCPLVVRLTFTRLHPSEHDALWVIQAVLIDLALDGFTLLDVAVAVVPGEAFSATILVAINVVGPSVELG
jgi:hypothetical protein